MRASRVAATLMASALVLVPTACSSSTGDSASTGSASAENVSSQLTIENAWVKTGTEGMSAAFGELVNNGDRDVVVRSATSTVSPVMELHETVRNADGQMVMREKEGGFVIPAHSTYLLQPGANHLMLMNIVSPIEPGADVEFSLVLDDGSDLTFSAPAKDYAGANETYVK